MDQPWGLSGPEFLLYYGIALVAAVGLAVYLRLTVLRPRVNEPVPAGDANVLAFVVDGRERVVETALARLVEQGAVRVTRAGLVTRTTRTVADPLDQAVLDALGGRTRRVEEVIRRAVDTGPVNDVVSAAGAHRLRIPQHLYRRNRRLGLAPIYLLVGVGVVRLITGAAGGYPIAWLLVELGATALVLVGLHWWGERESAPYTARGNQFVDDARGARDTATRVALRGLRAYPDGTVAAALRSTSGAVRQGPWSPGRRRGRAAAGAAVGGSTASCGSASSSCGSSGGGGSSGGCGGGGGG